MVGTEQCCSTRILSPFREESGDEELSVLPRHTKVVVTGNNRTKSVLVGLQGVVKKAVGLGGWHWLVLKNGVEVKLQRNALCVVEHPTGNEVDDDDDEDNDVDSTSGSDIGERDHDFSSGSELPKMNKLKVRLPALMKPTVRNNYREIQSITRTKQPRVNLDKLRSESLRNYCRQFKLVGSGTDPSREQMLNAVRRHFVSQPPLKEKQVIKEFIMTAKRQKRAVKPMD